MLSHFFNSLVATLPLAVRNSGGVAVFVRILWVATLLTMSIRARVIITITFQKVNHAPHSEASSQGDHQGLQYFNRAVEKIHIVPPKIQKILEGTHFPPFCGIGRSAYAVAASSSVRSTSYTS